MHHFDYMVILQWRIQGGSLGQLSPQTSVVLRGMAHFCHKCAPFWWPWK